MSFQDNYDALKAEGLELAQIYQRSLADPLRLGDDYQVYELISAPFHPSGSVVFLRRQRLEHIVLLDDAGKVLASSHPQLIPLGSSYIQREAEFADIGKKLKAVLVGSAPNLMLETGGKDFYVVAALGDNGVKYANLVLGYDQTALTQELFTQVMQSAIAIALVSLCMILLARLAALHAVVPLTELTKSMREFALSFGLI